MTPVANRAQNPLTALTAAGIGRFPGARPVRAPARAAVKLPSTVVEGAINLDDVQAAVDHKDSGVGVGLAGEGVVGLPGAISSIPTDSPAPRGQDRAKFAPEMSRGPRG